MKHRIIVGTLSLLLIFVLTGATQVSDTIIEWDGSCYNSQVYGLGNMTLIKTPNEENYDVTLIGSFSIYSPTEWHTRQELPPGFLPNSTDLTTYVCQEAINGGEQKTVSVALGSYDLDLLYENGSLWFPGESFGRYELTCQWKTDQPDPPISAWQSCPSITVKSLIGTPAPEPLPLPTPTFAPTAPAATPTFVPTTPASTHTPTPDPARVYIPLLRASPCLPGSCN